MEKDTITAIATPFGYSAIGVIRISGPKTFQIIQKIISCKKIKNNFKKIKTFYLYQGILTDPQSKAHLDQVLFSLMKKPKSYTGEDMAEIYCHGNPLLLKKILNIICDLGARVAEKGEFTKQAFLNQKIDLLKAEAVYGLTNAPSISLIKSYASELTKNFNNKKIEEIRKKLIILLSKIEALLEFPEDVPESEIKKQDFLEIKKIIKNLENIINDSEQFNRHSGMVKVALIGPVNSGKSTLFNTLVKKERAITSNLPGTTRDFLEEDILIKDFLFRIIDTAGFESSLKGIEKLAIDKTEQVIKAADLLLFIFDGSKKSIPQKWLNFLKKLKQENKNFIVVINKKDLINQKNKFKNIFKKIPVKHIFISALYQKGIDLLLQEIYKNFQKKLAHFLENQYIFNERQVEIMKIIKKNLKNVEINLNFNENQEIIAQELHTIIYNLDKITGKVYTEEMLSEIFRHFCIGK